MSDQVLFVPFDGKLPRADHLHRLHKGDTLMPGAYLPLTEAQRDRANERLANFAARGIVPDIAKVARGARLPDGLFEQDGVVMFYCESCRQPTELPVDPEEYENGHPHNVCGRSPRCCS